VAAATLPAMMKVTDGEANEWRRWWMTVADGGCGCHFTHEEEEK